MRRFDGGSVVQWGRLSGGVGGVGRMERGSSGVASGVGGVVVWSGRWGGGVWWWWKVGWQVRCGRCGGGVGWGVGEGVGEGGGVAGVVWQVGYWGGVTVLKTAAVPDGAGSMRW